MPLITLDAVSTSFCRSRSNQGRTAALRVNHGSFAHSDQVDTDSVVTLEVHRQTVGAASVGAGDQNGSRYFCGAQRAESRQSTHTSGRRVFFTRP